MLKIYTVHCHKALICISILLSAALRFIGSVTFIRLLNLSRLVNFLQFQWQSLRCSLNSDILFKTSLNTRCSLQLFLMSFLMLFCSQRYLSFLSLNTQSKELIIDSRRCRYLLLWYFLIYRLILCISCDLLKGMTLSWLVCYCNPFLIILGIMFLTFLLFLFCRFNYLTFAL